MTLNAELAEHAEKSLGILLRELRGLCVQRALFTIFGWSRNHPESPDPE